MWNQTLRWFMLSQGSESGKEAWGRKLGWLSKFQDPWLKMQLWLWILVQNCKLKSHRITPIEWYLNRVPEHLAPRKGEQCGIWLLSNSDLVDMGYVTFMSPDLISTDLEMFMFWLFDNTILFNVQEILVYTLVGFLIWWNVLPSNHVEKEKGSNSWFAE